MPMRKSSFWSRLFGRSEVAEAESRTRLRSRIQTLIVEWEPKLGVHVDKWNLRDMKLYWGSANPATRSITFDSKLADMPPAFLKITVVHELVHLRVPGHTDEFYKLMDQHVPGWRKLHDEHAGRMTPKS